MSHLATVLRYVDALNRGDFAAMNDLFTPDAQIHGVLGAGPLADVLPIWRDLHECLQMHLTVEAVVVAGAAVAVRYTERGRAVRPFRGLPATGRSYELPAMEWFELEGGRIRSRHGARDALSQHRQLGWLPG